MYTHTPTSDERKIHAGFRRAFRSVRGAALQAIKFIAPDLERDRWTIDCTGHSLGVGVCMYTHVYVPVNVY